MATYDYHQQQSGPSPDQLFSFDDISPTSAFFADITYPSTASSNESNNNKNTNYRPTTGDPNYLTLPGSQPHAQYNSLNGMIDDGSLGSSFAQYLSRPPSLSPSSQPHQPSHSPSSASPSSNFSFSINGSSTGADEMLLNNSFSSSELDMLLFQNDSSFNTAGNEQKPGQPFFLPQQTGYQTMINGSSNGNAYGMNQDQTFNMLNMFDANGGGGGGNGMKVPQLVQAPSLPQTIQPQWMSQNMQQNGNGNQQMYSGMNGQLLYPPCGNSS